MQKLYIKILHIQNKSYYDYHKILKQFTNGNQSFKKLNDLNAFFSIALSVN